MERSVPEGFWAPRARVVPIRLTNVILESATLQGTLSRQAVGAPTLRCLREAWED